MKQRSILARLVPAGLVVCAIAAFFAFGLRHYFTVDALRSHEAVLRQFVAAHAIAAPLAFVALYTAMVALSLPGAAVMTIAGGFIFGLWRGATLSVTGATLGAILLYLVARFIAGDALRTRAGPFIARMADGFERNAFSNLLFLRLAPFFPFFAVNLAAALLGVPLRTYAIATLIGIVPGSLAYTSIGDGLGLAVNASRSQITPLTIGLRVGFAFLALIPILVKWLRRRRSQ